MKRNTMLKIVNPVLGILIVNQILSGVFGHELFRISPKAFEILHKDGGFVFAAVALIHLILNWNWVKANYLKRAPAATKS